MSETEQPLAFIAESSRIERPIILVGCVRSGTTLLRLMLDSHPEIAFHFEFEFAVERISPDGIFPPLDLYRDHLNSNRIFQLCNYDIDKNLSYKDLINSFLLQKKQNKRFVGATIHKYLDRIPYLFEDARYIHLVRDPRDVARSIVAMGWAGTSFTATKMWLETERHWDLLRKHIPDHDVIDVRYEDLLEAPKAHLAKICHWAGVEYSPRMLDYPTNSSYGKPDSRLAHQWKSKARSVEIRQSEAAAGDALIQRSYEPSGEDALSVGAWRRCMYAATDWQWRLRFRIRRYGIGLYAADLLARKLRIHSIRQMTRIRIDDLDNAAMR
ncbi:Sulfotransferase domain protein [Roseimaritima multifibrata]|uniref:Sulfotransferase domain protein n=1 Tax=Roseimaritima multifibrata TaxID=1930274 RepID=A0A517MMG3_9BACT|nr:sulfotransferase [Roseimaritima multifibrata]QDS96079.1 Sulfotransferase domain protein [Roseimaritima multifibrata]